MAWGSEWWLAMSRPSRSLGVCTGPSLSTKTPLPLEVDFHSVDSPTIGAPPSLRLRKLGR